MTNKDNGGPAFPTVEANYHNENMRGEGMTLRDYFAAKAMQGRMASPLPDNGDMSDCASWAYEIADAMLLERAK